MSLILFYALGCSSSSTRVLPDPTLSSIQTNLFNSSCALSSCHSSGAHKGELALNTGSSYSQLVGVIADNEAAAADGKILVVPGDPDASFLIQKLEGPGADEGDLMPQTNDPLSQAEIDVIRQWITDGALDN